MGTTSEPAPHYVRKAFLLRGKFKGEEMEMKKAVLLFALLVSAIGVSAAPKVEPKGMGLAAAAGQNPGGHSVTLTWTASTSASCLTATTNPCASFGYIVYRGTISGGENVQLNTTPITTNTYMDSTITLTSSPQTFYYYVEAVETSGGIVVSSAPSNEVSTAFPGLPSPPTSVTVSGKN